MRHSREVQSKWNVWPAISLLIAAWLVVAGRPAAAQPAGNFEEKAVLKASTLISPELRKSDLFTVDEEVMNDGLLNHYTVRSEFGVFTAGSTLALKQLLHEIQAIAVMKRVETENTVTESLVQSGKNTVSAVTNLVTEPQKTIEGAAAGVSSLFSRASQVVGKRQTTEAEDPKIEQIIGKSKSKGEIATKYGVGVYSLNPVLQEELERLAWADYLGGLGLAAAQSVVPGAGGLLLTASGTARLLNDVINNTPASELWVRNKNKLIAMKINPDTVQLYLNNPSFSPALFTIMVDSMEHLKGVANRQLFVEVSLQANTHEMADAITKIATMMAGYHENVEPLQSLASFGRFLYGKTRKGTAVVVFPADHVLWSARVADAATWLREPAKGARPAGMQLWVLGDFSGKARAELENLGWELHPAAQGVLLPLKKKKT